MLFVLLLCVFRGIAGQYYAYNYGFDVEKHIKRQAQPQQLVLRGISVSDSGELPIRQEIRDLQKNDNQWTLYLLGLSMMQFTNQSDPTSWYGITGIHGVPFETWGGVGPTPGNELSGYCTHISVLFPTWHRPYLALYEQILYAIIQMIAGWWPDGELRAQYQAAAVSFRVPYWDFAARPPPNESVMPASIGGSWYVDVNGPSGVQRIANPLFNYGFKPLNSTAFIQNPFTTWTSTVRAPTSYDIRAQSNNTFVAMALDQNRASVEQRLYNLFANYDNYSLFSNEGWIPQNNDGNGSYDSLESVHDTIHNIAGGFSGHMSYIPFSAFDPIFFLHHANVDRLFAMWQTLYPASWILPTPAAMNSYTTSRGQIQDSSTALTPFFADEDGNFWTSDMVRDHTVFGYTYADVLSPGKEQQASNSSNVAKVINRLYGQSSAARFALGVNNTGKGSRGRTNAFSGSKYREWIANLRVEKQALGGPFVIHLFLGDAPGDTRTWSHAPNLFGVMSVFASPSGGGMAMSAEQMVSGTVPLTAKLVEEMTRKALPTLEIYDVVPFLKQNLQYRIQLPDGTEVKKVNSLVIEVVSHPVRAPLTELELPKWGVADTNFRLV